MSNKWVLLHLPNGLEHAVQAWKTDEERQLRGVALVEGCTLTPLLPLTPALAEAIVYLLDNSLDDYNVTLPETKQRLDMVRAALREAGVEVRDG